mmetsp:Transcript_24230/g.78968  ORF Transcript_24230/g.78968 Transcript_24230/m.78968 type:complete len:82 (+) Transcript_24230:1099-1344(+)
MRSLGTQMMMGNQENRFKVSRSGFDIQFLGYHLNEAGFSEFERVPEFNLFNDESSRKASASDVAHIAIPDAGHVISHLLMV